MRAQKRFIILRQKNARTGCTSAKSELSAFGLHCPCIVERTKQVLSDKRSLTYCYDGHTRKAEEDKKK